MTTDAIYLRVLRGETLPDIHTITQRLGQLNPYPGERRVGGGGPSSSPVYGGGGPRSGGGGAAPAGPP